jgi:hypothetical protein
VITVPLEPLFRLGNLSRRRYVARLGSTPGHLHTWGPLGFRRVVRRLLPDGRWFELMPWQGYLATVPIETSKNRPDASIGGGARTDRVSPS